MRRAPWLVLLCLLPACDDGNEREERARPERAPVFILAADGLEWSEVLPLLAADELPTFARLMATGRFGRLRSMKPTLSPIIWTTVATGKSPAQHGILGFGQSETVGGPVVSVFTNLDRRTKAFWEILSEQGLRVAVIGWWMTYPVDPIDGLMVAQVNTLDQAVTGELIKGGIVAGVANQVHPPERGPEILALHDRVVDDLPARLGRVFRQVPAPESKLEARLWGDSGWALRADATYLEIATATDPGSFDVVALYLGGTDVVAHRFWRHAHPEAFEHPPDPRAVAAYGGMIREYYRYVDRELGRILAAYGEPVTVMVVSDHGMRATNTDSTWDPDDGRARVSGGHVEGPAGLLILSGPGVRAPEAAVRFAELEAGTLPYLGSILDVTPTLLAHLGVPVGRDMIGEVLWPVIERLRHESSLVPTHDDDEWRRARARRRAEGVTIPAEDVRLEQLRALGYID